jgi:hypothetical protein
MTGNASAQNGTARFLFAALLPFPLDPSMPSSWREEIAMLIKILAVAAVVLFGL